MDKVFSDNSPINEAEEVYAFFDQFDELSIEGVKKCCLFHFKKIKANNTDMKLFCDLAMIHIKRRGVA